MGKSPGILPGLFYGKKNWGRNKKWGKNLAGKSIFPGLYTISHLPFWFSVF